MTFDTTKEQGMNTDHMEFAEVEQQLLAGSQMDRDWSRWYDRAEQLLGGNLDGDGDENGYSIDEANDFFRAKRSPLEYVSMVRERVNFVVRVDDLRIWRGMQALLQAGQS